MLAGGPINGRFFRWANKWYTYCSFSILTVHNLFRALKHQGMDQRNNHKAGPKLSRIGTQNLYFSGYFPFHGEPPFVLPMVYSTGAIMPKERKRASEEENTTKIEEIKRYTFS
jgi:hypothetical protein